MHFRTMTSGLPLTVGVSFQLSRSMDWDENGRQELDYNDFDISFGLIPGKPS